MQSLLSASAQIAHILYVKAPSEFSLLTTVSPQKKPSSRPSPPLALLSSSLLLFPALCQALEERLKQEQREEVHALKEAHRRTLDILRQQSDQELQTLRFELEDEGKAKLGK